MLSHSVSPRNGRLTPLFNGFTLHMVHTHKSLGSPLGYQSNWPSVTVLCSSHPFSSLMLRHHVYATSPHFISAGRCCVIPCHHKQGEHSTVRYFQRERKTDITVTFITIYCGDCSILLVVIVHFLQCLIYKFNCIVGIYREKA